MRGGRLIICAGNYETDFDPSGLRVNPVDTGLDDWLGHFGLDIDDTLVLDDRNQPLPIPEIRRTPFGDIRTWRMEPYPYLVEVRDDGFVDRQITSRLAALGIYWGSPVSVDASKTEGLETIEILKSSERSWTSHDLSRVSFVDYQVPKEGVEPSLLAVALSGKFKSYFADKQPPAHDPSGNEENPDSPSQSEVPLRESPETRLAVIGDAEFLSDFVARAIGQGDGGFFAENLAFMQNLIDWINLDNDMIGIRSRGAGVRRLARLDRRKEISIEAASYLLPAFLLLAFAALRLRRRRRVVPLVTTATADGAASGRVAS
jgi:ABC-2 type transport system permease protein